MLSSTNQESLYPSLHITCLGLQEGQKMPNSGPGIQFPGDRHPGKRLQARPRGELQGTWAEKQEGNRLGTHILVKAPQ
jgi:hypothetical protein